MLVGHEPGWSGAEMLCKDCDAIALFVAPPIEEGCQDGDLMCVVCGTAISFGGMLLSAFDGDARASSAA